MQRPSRLSPVYGIWLHCIISSKRKVEPLNHDQSNNFTETEKLTYKHFGLNKKNLEKIDDVRTEAFMEKHKAWWR